MNGRMSGLLLMMMIVISLWITLTFVPTEAQTVLRFNVATANETDYSHFLAEIRAELAEPNLHYGNTHLPVMRARALTPTYFYVNLEFEGGRTIKVAFSRDDLYVVGYLDMVDGRYRSQVFKDAERNAETHLFPEVTLPGYATRLFYKGSYGDIKNTAGVPKLVQLGIEPLRNHLNKVYGVQVVDTKKQATLLLIVIHMVSEAARSRYIEERIIEKFDVYYDEYVIDPKAESLELEWGKISMGIKRSINGVLDPALKLKNVLGMEYSVSQVRDIVGDMALLLNVGNDVQLSQYPKMFMRSSFVGNYIWW